MHHIALAVLWYLGFNLSVWMSLGEGGILAVAAANIIGATLTAIRYRDEIARDARRTDLFVALLGAVGILIIVMGLRQTHNMLPVSIAMEMVYSGFACVSWFFFTAFNIVFRTYLNELPKRFDVYCHIGMGVLVATRASLYNANILQSSAWKWVFLTVCGYCLYNLSLKLGRQHRLTNIAMNTVGALLLIAWAIQTNDYGQWQWSARFVGGALLGGISVWGIVSRLGAAYAHFRALGVPSIVAPMVYDGIILMSPIVIVVAHDAFTPPMVPVMIGMMAIAVVRYRYHATHHCQ